PMAGRAGAQGGNGGVIVLHAEVQGRARLHVPRLYRNERACAAFARACRADPHVRSVTVNATTGNALLLCDAGCDLDDIVERLARRRWMANGANRLGPPQLRSVLSIFLDQLDSLPVALLAASAAASVVTGGVADAIVILGVVLINAGIGYQTESQTEREIGA